MSSEQHVGAAVVRLPLTPRLCSNCVHAYFGQFGVWCSVYREDVWFETVAEECESFDPN